MAPNVVSLQKMVHNICKKQMKLCNHAC